MLIARFWFMQLLIVLSMILGISSPGYGIGWFDNFNDGNATDGSPLTWQTNASGFFPGTLDASSGDYVLSNPDLDDNSSIEASVNVIFTDTYVRSQVMVQPNALEQSGGTLGVWARYNPASVTGYLAILSSGAHLEILRIDPSASEFITTLGEVRPASIDSLTDAMIELDVVGDLLSVYLWRPGQPKPTTPEFTINDSTFPSGRAGILHNENNDGTFGVFRFAAAQSTPFLDGDYNNNGKVDAADYVVWRNGDSPDSTQTGYDTWKIYFGASGPGSGSGSLAAVPEPTGLVLALAAIGASILSGRRRRPF